MSTMKTRLEARWEDRLSHYQRAYSRTRASGISDEEQDRRADRYHTSMQAVLATPAPNRTAVIAKLDILADEHFGGLGDEPLAVGVLAEAKRFLSH